MAKFRLADGESELVKELVEGVRDGKRVANSRLIVTDRRIVLLVPKPGWLSRLLGALFDAFASTDIWQQRMRDWAAGKSIT